MKMLFNSLSLAIRSTLANKMRSFLTMLGIIIGVMSVVMLVSIGQGATGSITSAIASLGSDVLTVTVTDSDAAVTEAEAMSLAEYDAIETVSPYASLSATARSGSQYTRPSINGVTETYLDVNSLSLQSGRGIAPSDVAWRTNVAVIGVDVAEALFESYDVIGSRFAMSNRTFTVVGLLEESGTSLTGSLDAMILIPFSTAQRINGTTDVTSFLVKAASTEAVERAQTITETLLLYLTRDEDAYTVLNMSALLDTLDDVMSTLSLMLGGIAAISLLVGGIGIMNIMLVSVAERTREIGIRKAIGARRLHIMAQFLIEACVLSIIGGLLGIGLSWLGLRLFSLLADYAIAMEARAAVAALAFCLFIGVLFGSYPAMKASKLTPIDALQRR